MARVLGSYPIGRWFESYCRYHYGPLVKRLRHRPFTAESWVQFPYGSPFNSLGNSVISPFPSFAFYAKMPFVLCLFFISKNVVFRAGGHAPLGSFLLPEKSSAELTASETFALASSSI